MEASEERNRAGIELGAAVGQSRLNTFDQRRHKSSRVLTPGWVEFVSLQFDFQSDFGRFFSNLWRTLQIVMHKKRGKNPISNERPIQKNMHCGGSMFPILHKQGRRRLRLLAGVGVGPGAAINDSNPG